MRIDCRTAPPEHFRYLLALVDGAEIQKCFLADTDEGYALVWATDEWGHIRDLSDVVEIRGRITIHDIRFDPAIHGSARIV